MRPHCRLEANVSIFALLTYREKVKYSPTCIKQAPKEQSICAWLRQVLA